MSAIIAARCSTLLPASEAVIDGVPVAKLSGQVTPWDPCTGYIQHRLEKHAVTLLGWATGLMLDAIKNDGNFLPGFIR